MSENHRSESWLSFGLALVGGYCDAAGYVLAKTFTGHVTGAMVLAAISAAGRDWRTFLRNMVGLFFRGYGGSRYDVLAWSARVAWSRVPVTRNRDWSNHVSR